VERPLLGRLPLVRFDTARREPAGSAPSRSSSMRVRRDEVAGVADLEHTGLDGDADLNGGADTAGRDRVEAAVDFEHRAAAEAQAMGRHRRRPPHLRVVEDRTSAELDLGIGDWQVAPIDLAGYDIDGGGA
jgi:hypothetical protein